MQIGTANDLVVRIWWRLLSGGKSASARQTFSISYSRSVSFSADDWHCDCQLIIEENCAVQRTEWQMGRQCKLVASSSADCTATSRQHNAFHRCIHLPNWIAIKKLLNSCWTANSIDTSQREEWRTEELKDAKWSREPIEKDKKTRGDQHRKCHERRTNWFRSKRDGSASDKADTANALSTVLNCCFTDHSRFKRRTVFGLLPFTRINDQSTH